MKRLFPIREEFVANLQAVDSKEIASEGQLFTRQSVRYRYRKNEKLIDYEVKSNVERFNRNPGYDKKQANRMLSLRLQAIIHTHWRQGHLPLAANERRVTQTQLPSTSEDSFHDH